MTREEYRRLTGPFRNAKMARFLHICNRISVCIVMFSYAGLLLWELWQRDLILGRSIIVPLDTFLVVSVVRRMIDRQRPYERYDMPPVIVKKTIGRSFPSRHVASAFVIAMTFLLAAGWMAYGIFLLAVSVLIGGLRVCSGVHYPGDVIAGAGAGILGAIIGYLIL